MISPCSFGLSRANAPVRRKGYQIPHGHAGFRTARRGRRRSQSSRSVSKPEAYVRPNITNPDWSASEAKGSALSSSRRPCTKRSEEHTSELQSPCNLVCRLLLEKKK